MGSCKKQPIIKSCDQFTILIDGTKCDIFLENSDDTIVQTIVGKVALNTANKLVVIIKKNYCKSLYTFCMP